jgi:hypothetical protein
MQTNKIDLSRILLFAGIISLVLIYVLSWVDVINDPKQRTASDFMAFYAAGRNMLFSGAATTYDLPHLKQNEEDVLGFRITDQDVNPFVHPPFILPLLWIAAHFDYIPAFHIWLIFMLACCAVAAHFAVQLFPETDRLNKIAVWFGVVLFFPVFISFVNGQDSAILLLGAILWYYGLKQQSERISGLGLALTTIRPQIALMLAIPFLFNKKYRNVWWWFCLGSAGLIAISILIIGKTGVQSFLNILSVSASGEGYKINESAMVNLIGLIRRTLPTLDTTITRFIGWTGSLISLLSLIIIWIRSNEITDRNLALMIILALFASPHLHYHDLALLLIPLLINLHWLTHTQTISTRTATLSLLYLSLLLAFIYSIPIINNIFVYLLEAGLLYCLWAIKDRTNTKQISTST